MTATRPNHTSASARPVAWLGLPILLAAAPGCFSEVEQLDPMPMGPVAHNAEEAWPDAPPTVPAISHQEIAQACVVAGACVPDSLGLDHQQVLGLVDLCVHDAVFSAERAIPLSGFSTRNERAELYVSCVLSAPHCDAVDACATERQMDMYCEEAGCRPGEESTYQVSCAGSVATLTAMGSVAQRDCSRAFAECDVDSPTGCTDRHFSACPAGTDRADRCDGNIRLGCDGSDQVSYRDCSRLGGVCGTTTGGTQGCVYPEPLDADCQGDATLGATCDGTEVSVCVNGRRFAVPAAELCSPAE